MGVFSTESTATVLTATTPEKKWITLINTLPAEIRLSGFL